MKKSFFIAGLMLILSYQLHAQGVNPNKVYKYEVIRNKPDEMKSHFSFGFIPFYLDYNSLNPNTGISIEPYVLINNMASVKLEYQTAYLDRFKEVYNAYTEYGYAATPTTAYSSLNLMGSFYPVKQKKEVKESIHLKHTNIKGQGIDYTTDVPANRAILIGGRLGVVATNSFIQSTNGNIRFKGYSVTDVLKTTTEFGGNDYSTMIKTTSVAFGVSMIRISDLIINVEEFGKKAKFAMGEVYFDVLYASSVTLTNIMRPTYSYNTSTNQMEYLGELEYNVDDYTEKSKLGFRAGYYFKGYAPFSIFSLGIEIGSKPGPKSATMGGNMYILIKTGIHLSFTKIGSDVVKKP